MYGEKWDSWQSAVKEKNPVSEKNSMTLIKVMATNNKREKEEL